MQEIVAHLEKTLHCIVPFDTEAFTERIDRDSYLHWTADFPVAVIHHRSRMDEESRSYFETHELFETGGYTREVYDPEELKEVAAHVPQAVKRISYLCLGREDDTYAYRPKLPQDKWKKVVDNGTFKATIELSVYDTCEDICGIEATLRDLMRSSKEIPSLKAVGFVWVVVVPKGCDLEALLEHYFPGDWLKVDEETHSAYIGWSETLGEVNMRHFVCPPNKEKK